MLVAILLILLVFGTYWGVIMFITLPYWYETGNTPCEDIPRLPFTVRNVFLLCFRTGYAGGLLSAVVFARPLVRLVFPDTPRGRNKADKPESPLPPVLLVHGLYHNASGWIFLRRYLRKAGFSDIHVMSYATKGMTLAQLPFELEKSIADLEARYPGRKPLVVGHSLGGLTVRAWMAANAENQHRLCGVISLGSPLRGSKNAAVAVGTLGRSLIPTNPLFADLANREQPVTIPCLALVSPGDAMVLPQCNLVPPTPGWDMRVTTLASHGGLMVEPPVLRMIVWELYRMATGRWRPGMAVSCRAPFPGE